MRRIIGTLAGFVYMFAAGFMAVAASGGGHGNFGWLVLLFPGFLGGLFYPAAGFLCADLRARSSRRALGCLLIVNYILTAFMLYGVRDDILPDFKKSLLFDLPGVLIMSSVYLSAHIIILGLFVHSWVAKGRVGPDRDGLVITSLK